MAFDITATLNAIGSFLEAGGYFTAGVVRGEPKLPFSGRATAYWMNGFSVYEATLAAPREIHRVAVRFYTPFLEDPTGKIETDLASAASKLLEDLSGDLDLGATITNVDIAGSVGEPLNGIWGHVTLGDTVYRVVDIDIPLLVDDTATFTQ